MKVGFVLDVMNLRGMAVATYDYANYNEKLLNNESLLFYFDGFPKMGGFNYAPYEKFKSRFQHVVPFKTYNELHKLLAQYSVEFVYRISWGQNEASRVLLQEKTCPWGIHVVFKRRSPFGDKYAYISEWLRNLCSPKAEFVPHMIDLPKVDEDLREELNLPKDSMVLGCYGGETSFDLPFAQEAVKKALEQRSDIFFIFMNINKFHEHERCLFLPGTFDMVRKTMFINSCDAMLHARKRGETFGLAVGEFSSRNKPIITFALSPECEHYRILRRKAILYRDEAALLKIILDISKKDTIGDFDCYTRLYSPGPVMEKFSKVFFNK